MGRTTRAPKVQNLVKFAGFRVAGAIVEKKIKAKYGAVKYTIGPLSRVNFWSWSVNGADTGTLVVQKLFENAVFWWTNQAVIWRGTVEDCTIGLLSHDSFGHDWRRGRHSHRSPN